MKIATGKSQGQEGGLPPLNLSKRLSGMLIQGW
jgi:hypothetical protein